jgi:hypothetical protein
MFHLATIRSVLMPSRFSNSDPPDTPDASQQRARDTSGPQQQGPLDYEAEAVKTFELEVSAGRTARLTVARSADAPPPRLADLPAPRSTGASTPHLAADFPLRLGDATDVQSSLQNMGPPEVAAPQVSADVPLVGPTSQKKIAPTRRSAAHEPGPVATRRATKTGRLAPGVAIAEPLNIIAPKSLPSTPLARRRSSWWIVSLGLHALLLLCLAFTTLVVFQEQEQLELYTTTAVYETVEEFQDLEIDPADELEALADDLAMELDEPAAATFAELSSESFLDQPVHSELTLNESTADQATGSLGDVGQLFGENGSGMSEIGTGRGGAMVKFFGTEIKARRILYMLDNSGGMLQGGKFEALIAELQASVSVLEAKQQFYVIFFSDTVYPLFYPQSVRRFMPATDKNRKQLQQWLDSVELCTGNAIDEALAAAAVIQPDAVFLLTDGNLFTTENKKRLLLNRAGRPYSIHTFGLGVGEQTKTAAGLKQVAEANEGTFRAIQVSAATKELAQEKQRPYHSNQPGPVWGLKVGMR